MVVDVVVAGAGPVGLAAAAALEAAGKRVLLVDPQPEAALAAPGDDGREIALTDRSVALLEASGAWGRIPAAAVAPLRRMAVLNGPSDYAMRLGHDGGALGRFAPNHWLRRSLYEVAAARGGVALRAGCRVVGVRPEAGGTVATLSDGETVRAALVVAADTRRSRLRTQAGIGAAVHEYGQRMVVCPVAHPVPHEETATAWFEYGRTLVTLPLNGGLSSAVLTLPDGEAEALCALPAEALGRELTRRFRGRLGPMRPVGTCRGVPVVTAYAHRFAGPRFAVLGDAAVGMHPTTAHGFNFGLAGQAALARAIGGGDPGDRAALGRFQAAFRAETGPFFLAAEALMRLYAGGNSLPARLLRDAALRLGNLSPLRRALSAAAMG